LIIIQTALQGTVPYSLNGCIFRTSSNDDLKLQAANRYIINDVLLVCYLLVGLFGNISVILIFKFKLKTNKDDRYFIPWLALFDLLACSFRSSFELVRKIQPLRLYGTVPCKAVWMIINTSV
jgi:uncharacterized membrane protein YsdA (DUF1294 family)